MLEVLSSEDFQKKINEKKIMVVDFFAEWCSPCKTLAVTLEKASENYKNIDFVKIDIERSPDLTNKFMISSVPTVLVFKNGVVVSEFNGNKDYKKITSILESVL